MTNRGIIESIVFENYKTNKKTYGFTLKDDYAHVFYDGFDEDQLKLENEEFLKLVYNTETGDEDQTKEDIIDFAIKNGIGLEINGKLYGGDEVSEILDIK